MCKSKELPSAGNDDGSDITKEILDHINPRIDVMTPGQVTECEGLFEPWVWKETPPSERKHLFGDTVSKLVRQGKVSLEFAGISRNTRHNLYRRIETKPLPGCGGIADISGDADSTCTPDMPPLSKPEDTF